MANNRSTLRLKVPKKSNIRVKNRVRSNTGANTRVALKGLARSSRILIKT